MALSAKEWEELYKKAEAKAQEKEDVYRALAKKQIANQFKNNNVLEGVAYGAKTGINQVQSGFESAGLGLQHTVADVLGMDEKANELAIALKKSAQEQAQRQAKINSQYDTNFGGIAKAASDVTAGAVGMLPTIGAAVITPQGKVAAAGKLAQVGAKALRALPSAGVMGAQATGAGINQALNEGANINQAKAYGLGSAVKEVATELPFAGIAKVPGLVNVGQKLAGNKMASGVINAATEGAEEAVAEAIDPQLQRWTYNPNADNASLDDMLYSALIGAGTAGLINSGFAGAGKAANMALGTAKNKKMLPTAPKNAQNQGISPQNAQNGAGQAQTSQTTKYLPRPDKTAQNQIIEVEKIRKQMEKEQAELLKQKNALWAQKEQMEQAERDNLYREIKNLEETINLLRGTQSSAFDDALFNAMDEYTAPQQKEKLSFDMPMSERTLDNVSNPKVKAYQSTHPEVKAFFREQAEIMLNDLNNMIDGGREYGIDPETRNVNVVRSQTRATSSQIERLLNAGMTKAQIRDGLERIIRDNGAENTANAKKVETTLDDALANGYQSMQGPIPKNLDYVYNNADIKKMQNAYGKLNSEESFANAADPAGLINELQYLDDRITERQQLIDAYSELLPDMSVYETMTAEELHNEMAKLENASQYAPNEIAGEMMARHRYLELLEEGRVNEFIENENMKTHVANMEKQLADKKLSFELPRASDDIKKIQKKLDEIEAKQAGISVFNKAQNENPNDIRPKLKRPVQPEPTVAENTTVTEQSPKVGSERDYEDFDVNQLPKDVLDFYDNVGQVGKKAGFNVRVVTGIEHDANGMFDGRGNILIDGNKMTDEKTISRVIGHEGFHFLKDTGEHKYIIDLAVNDGMQKEGLTKDQLIQKKIEDYYKRSKGKVVLDRDGALDEIGAEFMEKILTDPKLAERVWNQNPTLAQRIMWWLEDMVQKITGKADENPNAEIYRKALDAYSRGLRNMQYQNRSQGESRYMFAGEKSRTADREALARAQQMEADGVDMETIRQQTGWFKSKVTGNKWAYEISDKGVQFDRNAPRNTAEVEVSNIKKQMGEALANGDFDKFAELNARLKELPVDNTPRRDVLGDWLAHPELYEAYPQLREMQFELNDTLGFGVGGRYDRAGKIEVNADLGRLYPGGIPSNMNIDRATGTTLHEIQHAIQQIEGFPNGSNPQYWDEMHKNYIRTRSPEATRLAKEKNEIFKQFPYELQNLIRLHSNESKAGNYDESAAYYEQIEEFVAQHSEYADLWDRYGDVDWDLFGVLRDLDSQTPDDLYKNTAGEIMARDTAQRRGMDADQRRQKQPAIGDENTVYADGGSSYSIVRTTDGKPVVRIESDIFADMKPGEKKHDIVANYIKSHIGEVYTIIESGQKVYIGEDLPGEFTHSQSTQRMIEKKNWDRLNAKNQSLQNVGELIEIATNRDWKRNTKKKHEVDAKYGWYHYDTRFSLPDGQVYTAELLIRNDANGKKYLYDLIKVKEDGSTLASTQKGSAIRADESALAGSNHLQSDNIIPENQRKVNDDTRYSLDELVDEYGAIPKGEDPYGDNRDIDIPQQTADDNRVSRFARTAAESRNVDDEAVDEIKARMERGEFTYEPSGNQEQINRANALINHTGWERQLEQFQNKYRSGQAMTADDIVLGERLIQEAQNAGDYKTAVDLIADIAAIGTELGQAVQALSVLKRLTPESKVKALKRVEERINADLIERKVKPVDEVKGKPIGEIQSGNVKPDHYRDVKLEIASQQNFDNEFLQVKIPDELLTQMLQAESQQMQSEIWDNCVQELANQVPATLADKINAWRYLAMLSNPKTHIRNMVGNSVMRSVSAVKRGIQTSLENRLLTAGEERYTELNRNVPKEYFDFAEVSWQNEGKKRAEASGGRYNDAVGQVERKKRIFKIELLEKWRKGNENALFGEDMMFKKSAYINALARYMHTNGLAPSELQSVASNASYEKGVAFALKEADKATFQEASKVANLLSRMEHSSPVAKLLMGGALPFKKTPINILKRGVEYSPVGLMNGLYKMRYDVQNGKMTKAEAIDAISAGLTGTGIMVLGYFMASMGWITAGAGEDDERKQWYDQSMGSQNYALVLPNGGTATIDWLAPSVMPLMAGAELYSQLTSENPANENSSAVTSTLEAISKVANPVLEMSMLQGVTGALQSYNSGTTGVLSDLITSTATSYGGQFIPAPVGAMARTVDDTVRSSYAPKDSAITKTGEKFIRQQVNKLPFASMTNEASIDVWGNEVKRAGGNIVGRAFNNFLNPATYSSDKRTELDKKLNELYEATGNSGVLPKSGTTYINESDSNPKVYLSAKEYAKYGTTRGQNSYQYVNSFVNSSAYSQLADEDKAEIISNLYDLANYQAKKEALNGRGYNYVQEQYEKVLKSKMEPQKYYIAKYNMDLIADNVTTGQKKEQISYLKGLQQDGVITDEQCWYLRRAMIGKFSKSEMAACPYAWIKQL